MDNIRYKELINYQKYVFNYTVNCSSGKNILQH